MKVELSKKEFEVVLELMKEGKTFMFSHSPVTYVSNTNKANKKAINIDDLIDKMSKKIKEE